MVLHGFTWFNMVLPHLSLWASQVGPKVASCWVSSAWSLGASWKGSSPAGLRDVPGLCSCQNVNPRVMLGSVDCSVDALMARALGCVVRLLLRDLAKFLVDRWSWKASEGTCQPTSKNGDWRWCPQNQILKSLYTYVHLAHLVAELRSTEVIGCLSRNPYGKRLATLCWVKCSRSIKAPRCIVMKNTWQVDAIEN